MGFDIAYPQLVGNAKASVDGISKTVCTRALFVVQNEKRDTMALIPCPECGRMVSPNAEQCPGCGAPIKELLEHIAETSSEKQTDVTTNPPDVETSNDAPEPATPAIDNTENTPIKKQHGILTVVIAVAVVAAAVLIGVSLMNDRSQYGHRHYSTDNYKEALEPPAGEATIAVVPSVEEAPITEESPAEIVEPPAREEPARDIVNSEDWNNPMDDWW